MDVQELGVEFMSLQLEWKIKKLTKLKVMSPIIQSSLLNFRTGLIICLVAFRQSTNFYDFGIVQIRPSDIVIYWTISFIDRQRQERFTERGSTTFKADGSPMKWGSVAKLDISKAGMDLLLEDTLTIHYVLSVDGDCNKLNAITQTGESLFTDTEPTRLLRTPSSGYGYARTTDSDCVLKAGAERFPVHRAVVPASSPVFTAMFHRHDQRRSKYQGCGFSHAYQCSGLYLRW